MRAPVEEILGELRAGRMVVLTDDRERENEGDLVLAAEHVTPEALTFMLREARGYLCLSLTGEDCDRLGLEPQTGVNTSVHGTAFTVSIDGHPKHGFTTGVSARERARTIRLAIDPESGPDDFVRPGHINPLRARAGGVLVRTGQTEGSVDLCRLAGLYPAAVIIEIVGEDGEMARGEALEGFCRRHGLKMCSVADVISYRLARESLVRRVEPMEGVEIRTPEGPFRLYVFESLVDPLVHLALCVGGVGALDGAGRVVEHAEPVLVRVHRRHLLGDVFLEEGSSSEGATGETLRRSMRMIQRAGAGAVVYLRPEGVGDGLTERLSAIRRGAYRSGADEPDLSHPGGIGGAVFPADQRELGIGSQILRQLGLRRVRILSNSPKPTEDIEAFGLKVEEWVPVREVGRSGVRSER